MRTAPEVKLNEEQRELLGRQVRSRSLPAHIVERARIILRAAEGWQDQQIGEQLGMTPQKAALTRALSRARSSGAGA